MTKIAPPSPPYVGPAKHTMGSNNKPIYRVVIHATVGSEPGVKGAARGVASMFRTTDRYASAHYVADAAESVQVVYDSLIAEHAPPNQHSIGYELCCSLSGEGKGHWDKADHQAMLKRVADDVARLCLAYDVPIVKLSSGQLRAGQHGICGHIDVSNAWHQTTHWDPGPYFPWDQFIGLVKAAADKLQSPNPSPPPAPKPTKKRHPGANRVAILNVKSVPLMPADKVKADVEHGAREAGVIMWQEIQPDYYKSAVLDLIGKGFHTAQIGTEVPISYRADVWDKEREGKKLTHLGLAKVSPNRYVTWARLRHHETDAEIVFVNTHMVSAAWSARRVAAKDWRKKMWGIHFRKESRIIRRFVRKGYTVIVGGDLNRVGVKDYAPGQVDITHSGIDHLAVISAVGGARVQVIEAETVKDFNSDHDLKRAWIKVEAPEAA